MSIQNELLATIQDLVQPGKGILAADESASKRLVWNPRKTSDGNIAA